MLDDGSISVYHFSIIINLAWLSSNTHLTSLLILRRWLSDQRARTQNHPDSKRLKAGSPLIRIWRALCMVILAILLIEAIITSGCWNWNWRFNCPAKCVPRHRAGGVLKKWMIASLVLLLIDYQVFLILTFETSTDLWISIRTNLQSVDPPKFLTSESIKPNHKWLRKFFVAVWFLFASNSSMLSERSFGLLSELCEQDREDTLGFGQLLPLILLMLPSMVFVEAYHDKAKTMTDILRRDTENEVGMSKLDSTPSL
ncbi:hypothetical protein W97_01558 [Coniosporium apollinis CBS 100218]|uniref:Uncharacterized protein n=1 Tax=Coniosporium apollinis (strain CBS 100218) TaxID=1168221 RepID=R7YK82_CONA1|nr:uncharacterized protein W97_01558 [Coniosporium apollinis CBS 100218]EON62337.1 hypothetical protein W97_01558 [Coniosporium apollinis CBS 100218]